MPGQFGHYVMVAFYAGYLLRRFSMNDENNSHEQDNGFQVALGWLAALSVSIASWAGLS
jgi:hypothetical protein